jgi:hypothetical protein
MRQMRTKFILGALGRVTPLTITLIIAVMAPDKVTKVCSYAAAVLLLITVEYFGVFRPLATLEELRKKLADHYLKSFVNTAAIGDNKVRVRVNVMLIRYFWFRKHFYQFYQAGMAGFPDANLHFSVHKGFCGKALMEQMQKVSYINLTETPWEGEWSEKEAPQVSHITAIATIPLLREFKAFRGHPKTEYFGCLNVDAIDAAGADFLATPKAQEQILALAELVQVTLS